MGRRRAARTPLTSAPSGRALTPLTPTDLVKHVPRKFATLWVGTASGHPTVPGPSPPALGGVAGAEAVAVAERGRTDASRDNAGAGASARVAALHELELRE